MGMYDSLDCKYPLPLPNDCMEMKGIDFCKDLRFQTKDFECGLELYEIREDGTIWRFEFETIIDEEKTTSSEQGKIYKRVNERWVQLQYFSDTISFYDYYQSNKFDNDYWVEYNAVFDKGQLKTIELIRFEPSDNTRRNFLRECEERQKLWNKWYMKYGYAYYDMFISYIFKKWRRMCEKLPSALDVERWLRPL